jgi:hypothetical protein
MSVDGTGCGADKSIAINFIPCFDNVEDSQKFVIVICVVRSQRICVSAITHLGMWNVVQKVSSMFCSCHHFAAYIQLGDEELATARNARNA